MLWQYLLFDLHLLFCCLVDLTFRKTLTTTRGFLPFCTGILEILDGALGPLIFGFNLHRVSRLNVGQDHPTLQEFTVNTMESCFSGETVQLEDIGAQSAQKHQKKHQQRTSCAMHFLLFETLLRNHQNCTYYDIFKTFFLKKCRIM